MTPGQPWARPAPGTRPGLAALVSLLLHAACLGAVIGLFNRAAPTEPVPERGVEIVWDQEAAEAVSEAEAPALPGAPPEAAAPPLAEAPPAPAPPPALPMLAPPPPMMAMAPPPPAPMDLPPLDLPMPDLRVAALPEAPPEPPQEVAAERPLPEPPPPTPPEPPPPEARPTPPRPRPARAPQRSPPPAEASRPGEEAAAPTAAGIGRATGAVVPPGPDTRYQNAAPSYPEAARLRGEQGTVALELAVGVDGRVTAVNVARSSGSPMLDAAARRTVQEWRFRPATRDGEAVPGTIRTSVHFRLQ